MHNDYYCLNASPSYCLFCHSSTFHIRIWEGYIESFLRMQYGEPQDSACNLSWPQHCACLLLPLSKRIIHQFSVTSVKSVHLESQMLYTAEFPGPTFPYCRWKCIIMLMLIVSWNEKSFLFTFEASPKWARHTWLHKMLIYLYCTWDTPSEVFLQWCTWYVVFIRLRIELELNECTALALRANRYFI